MVNWVREHDWWPLLNALSWALVRDDDFATSFANQEWPLEPGALRFPSNAELGNEWLVQFLRRQMEEAGCFQSADAVKGLSWEVAPAAQPLYRGKFSPLLEEYAQTDPPADFDAFLRKKLVDCADRIIELIARGKLKARAKDEIGDTVDGLKNQAISCA